MSKVGTGFLFAFTDPQLGDDGDYTAVIVGEKKFFDANGHIECEHFNIDGREMPPEFWEAEEATFLVESATMSKDEVYTKMLELGFEESPAFSLMMAS